MTEMKRFDVAGCIGYCNGGYHMKEDVDGEYVTYESHVEAMKRIAGDGAEQTEPMKEVSDRELFEQWSKDHGWDAGIAFRYVPRDADAYEYHLEMACRWEGFHAGRSFIAGRAFIPRAAPAPASPAALPERTMSFAEATNLWNRITNYSDSAATHLITRFANALLAAAPADEDTRDAARYRFMRSSKTDLALVIDKIVGEMPYDEGTRTGGYPIYEYRAGEELDSAIDAAMSKGDANG